MFGTYVSIFSIHIPDVFPVQPLQVHIVSSKILNTGERFLTRVHPLQSVRAFLVYESILEARVLYCTRVQADPYKGIQIKVFIRRLYSSFVLPMKF